MREMSKSDWEYLAEYMSIVTTFNGKEELFETIYEEAAGDDEIQKIEYEKNSEKFILFYEETSGDYEMIVKYNDKKNGKIVVIDTWIREKKHYFKEIKFN